MLLRFASRSPDEILGRVISTITIDDRRDQPHHLEEMVRAVEQHLGHKAKYGEEVKKVIVQEF